MSTELSAILTAAYNDKVADRANSAFDIAFRKNMKSIKGQKRNSTK